jgi:ribosome-interacting GTPase 1
LSIWQKLNFLTCRFFFFGKFQTQKSLNQRKPDVTVTKRKSGGGVRFASTVPQTQLGPEPEKLVAQILREYRITAADVSVTCVFVF